MVNPDLNPMKESYLGPLGTFQYMARKHTLERVIGLGVILGLTVSILVLAAKNPMIITVAKGVPTLMQVAPVKKVSELTDYQIFIATFLDRLYNWDSANYSVKVQSGLALMAPSLRQQYLNLLKKNGLSGSDNSAGSKVFSRIAVQRVSDKAISYKDGYQTEAFGIRSSPDGCSNKTVKFRIGLREVEPTTENFWGLEVFEIVESEERGAKS